jgi:N-acetylglucosamine repressor
VINGLMAQLDAPLLCLGIGVPGIVNISRGVIRHSASFGWRNFPLADLLCEHYGVPVYIDHNTELIAIAQYAFVSNENTESLAAIRIGHDVAIGVVFEHGSLHYGGDIGFMPMSGRNGSSELGTLESFLGWSSISQRAAILGERYETDLPDGDLSYLDLRRAIFQGDPLAIELRDDLAHYLEQLFVWIIGLLRPDHIALAGDIVDLGPALLEDTVARLEQHLYPELVQNMSFSLADATTLSARGAVARSVRMELGIL